MNVTILFGGYSDIKVDGHMNANCSCTLITGPPNIIVDTMTPWDGENILKALRRYSIQTDDIDFVVCTHGHSDHTGCNYLFKKAIHIVGYSISHKDKYFLNCDFGKGDEYTINDMVKVIPTPGHTLQDVSVIVESKIGRIAITGDLFEKCEDLNDSSIWKNAGSDSERLQIMNREKVLQMVDYIIPGHGTMFKVPENYKRTKIDL